MQYSVDLQQARVCNLRGLHSCKWNLDQLNEPVHLPISGAAFIRATR